ncbi:hypothetical protein DSM112329_00175 [Paraconexibacter sp. AEG42_29]|uniref:Uncharacterized protein n=1 Tax=Paraconexibacter sp. AEG42_29 TaxID=2997339 RepID=A0AAU7AP48_9ACTN
MMYPPWKYAHCKKCGKKVRMTACKVCKGQGKVGMSQCRNACGQKGYLCPTHGKNY